jgi:hypothetical protein
MTGTIILEALDGKSIVGIFQLEIIIIALMFHRDRRSLRLRQGA